jgi:hypothetical protein
MRLCSDCGTTKDLADFYSHPYGRDGKFHICKDCHKHRMFAQRRDNPKVQERERRRAKEPRRIETQSARTKNFRAANPAAYKAQTAVGNAIRDGKLVQEPCSVCASTFAVHAHHKDYAQALAVIWLCARCHSRLHALFPELSGLNKNAPIAEVVGGKR